MDLVLLPEREEGNLASIGWSASVVVVRRHAVGPGLQGQVGVVEVAAPGGVIEALAGGQVADGGGVQAQADQGVVRGDQVHRAQILQTKSSVS